MELYVFNKNYNKFSITYVMLLIYFLLYYQNTTDAIIINIMYIHFIKIVMIKQFYFKI